MYSFTATTGGYMLESPEYQLRSHPYMAVLFLRPAAITEFVNPLEFLDYNRVIKWFLILGGKRYTPFPTDDSCRPLHLVQFFRYDFTWNRDGTNYVDVCQRINDYVRGDDEMSTYVNIFTVKRLMDVGLPIPFVALCSLAQ